MGPLPPAVLSREEPIHLSLFLSAPRATTPSPTSLSSSFPLPIPPHLASPSPSINNKDIIARDEAFFTPEGSPAPSYFNAEVEDTTLEQTEGNNTEPLPDYEAPQRP